MPYKNESWVNNPPNPFKHSSPELEAYMNGEDPYTLQSGRGMKSHNVTAARSGMSEFIAGNPAERRRRHLFVCLSGAGVHADVAEALAYSTVPLLPARQARVMAS